MPTLLPPTPIAPSGRARVTPCDARAFPEIRPHVPRMLAVARSILESDDLAWDAVQETLLRLWHEEREPRDLRGWLVRAVAYRSLDAARALRRRRAHEQLAAAGRSRSAERDPSDELDRRSLATLVGRALDSLPREFAEAFRLHEIDGLDYPAIAVRIGAPIGTVRSRIHRARRGLRSALAGLVHDERSCSICAERR